MCVCIYLSFSVLNSDILSSPPHARELERREPLQTMKKSVITPIIELFESAGRQCQSLKSNSYRQTRQASPRPARPGRVGGTGAPPSARGSIVSRCSSASTVSVVAARNASPRKSTCRIVDKARRSPRQRGAQAATARVAPGSRRS